MKHIKAIIHGVLLAIAFGAIAGLVALCCMKLFAVVAPHEASRTESIVSAAVPETGPAEDIWPGPCLTISTRKGDCTMHVHYDTLEIEDPCNVMDDAARVFFGRYIKGMVEEYIARKGAAADMIALDANDRSDDANDVMKGR